VSTGLHRLCLLYDRRVKVSVGGSTVARRRCWSARWRHCSRRRQKRLHEILYARHVALSCTTNSDEFVNFSKYVFCVNINNDFSTCKYIFLLFSPLVTTTSQHLKLCFCKRISQNCTKHFYKIIKYSLKQHYVCDTNNKDSK